MSSKLAQFLQEHVMGEVLAGADARDHFSRDSSMLQITPQVIVYPRNEQDVRKVVRILWQLAERGRSIGITARGAGSDLTGASLGEGVIIAMPAHMNRIVSLDKKKGLVSVESGTVIAKAQQALHVDYMFLPFAPASAEYATIGGAIANNSSGNYSEKYGDTADHVSSLRVVLANGEVITTKKLSKRELSKKLGLANFEGQVYRQLDSLLSENENLISNLSDNARLGYRLNKIKGKDGSFDIGQLFTGSQGTLGIVTEAELKTEVYNPQPNTILARFDSLTTCLDAVLKLQKYNPAVLEMIDGNTLKHISRIAGGAIKTVLPKIPEFALLVEFDDSNQRTMQKNVRAARKIFKGLDVEFEHEKDETGRERLWQVKNAIGHVLSDASSKGRAMPGVESATVSLDKYEEFYSKAGELFKKFRLPFMAWGHIGMGQLSMMPKVDLGEVSGRQRILRLMDEYHELVTSLGGNVARMHNDGRLRGHYLEEELGRELYDLHVQIKNIFDPHSILNPGVKIGADRKNIIDNMVATYQIKTYSHLPRL